mmetsp:Transcript_96460/g.144348  ORF Transcript_96460/g.144348 Transcript_96460/m.144348 type:complete len:101 (-) Transcript_96460:195-497(-)
MTEETTTETPPAPVEDTTKEEQAPDEPKEATPEEDKPEATAEKKSIFAMMCGCLGGSAPAPDTDTKEPPSKEAVDDEKEETDEKAEKPAEEPAAIAPAEA